MGELPLAAGTVSHRSAPAMKKMPACAFSSLAFFLSREGVLRGGISARRDGGAGRRGLAEVVDGTPLKMRKTSALHVQMPMMPISLAIALVIRLFALRLSPEGPPGMPAANRAQKRP